MSFPRSLLSIFQPLSTDLYQGRLNPTGYCCSTAYSGRLETRFETLIPFYSDVWVYILSHLVHLARYHPGLMPEKCLHDARLQ